MPSVSPKAIPSPFHTPSKPPMEPNVANVVLGNITIKPWYPSFYPEELIGGRRAERLFVCQWCFKYSPEIMKYMAHTKVCPMKDEPPPGGLIYEKNCYSIHQLDGEEHKLYTQNLSLFAKLFLDTKSVFYDVSTFLYYALVLTDPTTHQSQVVGFFSKEKMSWDNNNVACILIFPPWQRRGLGQILMAVSYVLGKQEGRLGGPERPLSTLGRKGYIAYWCGAIYRYVLSTPLKRTVTIKDISDDTWIMPEDIVAALKEMEVVDGKKKPDGTVVINKSRMKAWAEKSGVSPNPVVDLEAFVSEDEFYEEEDEMED